MLTQLRIANLAQLGDTTLDLGPGLTAITGETGAGKTMVLTALRLLTGGRADAKIVAAGKNRTEVDASARLDPEIALELEEGGFAIEDGEATFSRTVLSEGGSRAAISGRPVPAKALTQTLGSQVTIHGQADQWRLRTPREQRLLLDRFAGGNHQELLGQYREAWEELRQAKALAEAAEAGRDQREVELRYLQEAIANIEALELAEDEEEVLETSIDRLTNVQAFRESTLLAAEHLGGEGGGADRVGMAAEALMRSSGLDPQLRELADRTAALEAEAQTLSSDLREYAEALLDDPEELSRLHERRAALTDLMRGRAVTVAELLDWLGDSKARVAALLEESQSPKALRQAVEKATDRLEKLGSRLSKSRGSAAKRLGEAVDSELSHLALRDANFIVDLEESAPTRDGFETVVMQLRSHPNAVPAPLGAGVSGGELSRIMLALEVVTGEDEGPQTMVFDEIDAGIGGEVANQLARRLKRLSTTAQVVVVTHLPQVAALADANFAIEKVDGVARVRSVSGEDKTSELVRMLGGDPHDEATRQVAKAMEEVPPVAHLLK